MCDTSYHFEPYYDVQDSILEFSDRLPEWMTIDAVYQAMDRVVDLLKSRGVGIPPKDLEIAKEEFGDMPEFEDVFTFHIPITNWEGNFDGVYLAFSVIRKDDLISLDVDFSYPWDVDDEEFDPSDFDLEDEE